MRAPLVKAVEKLPNLGLSVLSWDFISNQTNEYQLRCIEEGNNELKVVTSKLTTTNSTLLMVVDKMKYKCWVEVEHKNGGFPTLSDEMEFIADLGGNCKNILLPPEDLQSIKWLIAICFVMLIAIILIIWLGCKKTTQLSLTLRGTYVLTETVDSVVSSVEFDTPHQSLNWNFMDEVKAYDVPKPPEPVYTELSTFQPLSIINIEKDESLIKCNKTILVRASAVSDSEIVINTNKATQVENDDFVNGIEAKQDEDIDNVIGLIDNMIGLIENVIIAKENDEEVMMETSL